MELLGGGGVVGMEAWRAGYMLLLALACMATIIVAAEAGQRGKVPSTLLSARKHGLTGSSHSTCLSHCWR